MSNHKTLFCFSVYKYNQKRGQLKEVCHFVITRNISYI
jgi:hypothetical protein